MSGSPHRRDPLAVSTRMVDGEEIVWGNPGVTDQERAAAGRETVVERSRALLAHNRRRAAERYAAPQPGDDEVTRVWCPRERDALRARVRDAALAVWAEDDILHVIWQGHADLVQLTGGAQAPLWPVPSSDDLWEASLRIRRLAEAVISIMVLPQRSAELPFGRPASDQMVWRGPRAPALLPVTESLAGVIADHVIDSTALGAARGVTIYRPPGVAGPLRACIMADGQSVRGFARVLEPAIRAGTAPAVLLVGVHNAVESANAWRDLRGREYVRGHDRRRFDAHLRFVADEVIPWATEQLDAATGPWLAAGFSNGAAWSITAAQRRPDLFAGVAALSAGIVPSRINGAAKAAGVRHYLAAGTMEGGFRESTRRWAERLQRAGLACSHHEWVGGHDNLWWEQQLPAALGWLLASHE